MKDIFRGRSFESEPEEYTIGNFTLRIRQVNLFSYHAKIAIRLENGLYRIQDGLTYVTYGAGPCVDGITIEESEEDPSLFHISPSQFDEEVEEIDSAIGGIIGGSVDAYANEHPSVRTGAFIELPGYPISILVQRHQDTLLDISYISGF